MHDKVNQNGHLVVIRKRAHNLDVEAELLAAFTADGNSRGGDGKKGLLGTTRLLFGECAVI